MPTPSSRCAPLQHPVLHARTAPAAVWLFCSAKNGPAALRAGLCDTTLAVHRACSCRPHCWSACTAGLCPYAKSQLRAVRRDLQYSKGCAGRAPAGPWLCLQPQQSGHCAGWHGARLHGLIDVSALDMVRTWAALTCDIVMAASSAARLHSRYSPGLNEAWQMLQVTLCKHIKQ